MRISSTLSLAILAMAVAGCATGGLDSYPVEWSSIKSRPTDDGCPNLVGTYRDIPTASIPKGTEEPPTLQEIFTRLGAGPFVSTAKHVQNFDTVPSVSIEQTAEKLILTFTTATGDQTQLNFRRYHFSWSEEHYNDLFTCYLANGSARLRFFVETGQHQSYMSHVYIEGGGTLVFLQRAVDGSLAVQWRSESLLLTSVVIGSRMTYDGSIWYRFPLLDTARSN